MSTQMTIELSAEKPRKHEFYRATLDLPATELQIEDALSKARFQKLTVISISKLSRKKDWLTN